MSDKIKIDVEAGTAHFVNDMKRAGDSVERLGHSAGGAHPMLEKLKEGLAIGSGIEAAHKGMELLKEGIEKVKEAWEEMGKIGRDALKLGVGVDDMSRFQHAANATHTDVSSLEMGVNRLNETIGKVASGDESAKSAGDALKKLGVDARDLAGLDPAETFERVSAAISGMTDKYQRAAVVQELMGKGGRELIPLMSDLKSLMKESDEIGFTRTPEQIEKVEEEERKLAAITDEVKGLLMDIAGSDFTSSLVAGFKGAWDWAHKLVDAVQVLAGGNPAMERRVAELNHMAREADDHAIKMAQAAVAAHDEGDADKKVAAYRKYLALLEEQYQLEQRNAKAGVADADPRRLKELETFARYGVEQYHLLQQQADAQHRLNAEKEREASVQEDVNKEVARLKQELAGTDKYGSLLAKLTAEGATGKQIGEVGKLVGQLKEADRLKHELADFDALWKKSETPLDHYNEQLKELNDLLAHGKISQEQFNTAARQAKLEMTPDAKGEAEGKQRLAENVSRRFTFDLAGQSHAAADLPKQALELQKKQDQRSDQWTTWFQQIWQQITQGGPSGSAAQDTTATIA